MSAPSATPLKNWISDNYCGTITGAASVLGIDRSTLHRVMGSAYVIDGVLYTKARASK